jgi:predicted RecB family nuclease
VERMAKLYGTPPHLIPPLIGRFVDLHRWVTEIVTLPIESYTLKLIARWLGFEWRDTQANGAQAIYWYTQWLESGDRAFLDAIISYNEDDCRATFRLKDWLVEFIKTESPSQVVC